MYASAMVLGMCHEIDFVLSDRFNSEMFLELRSRNLSMLQSVKPIARSRQLIAIFGTHEEGFYSLGFMAPPRPHQSFDSSPVYAEYMKLIRGMVVRSLRVDNSVVDPVILNRPITPSSVLEPTWATTSGYLPC